MKGMIRRILSKSIKVKQGKSVRQLEIKPSEKLVLGVQFAIIALICLTALEIAYMVVVKSFSSEIFAAMTLVIGTILGAFFGAKA